MRLLRKLWPRKVYAPLAVLDGLEALIAEYKRIV